MSHYLDHINTMSYDATGAFNTYTGNQAAFSNAAGADSPIVDQTENKWNVMDTVAALESQGVPTYKVIVGLPSYGRVWEDVSAGNDNLHGMFEVGTAPSGVLGDNEYEWEIGAIGYACMLKDFFTIPWFVDQWTTQADVDVVQNAIDYCNDKFTYSSTRDLSYLLVRDNNGSLKALQTFNDQPTHGDESLNFQGVNYPYENIIASYYYHPDNNRFITYDSPTMIGIKTQWVENKKLGGVMFWEVNAMPKSVTSPNLFKTSYDVFKND